MLCVTLEGAYNNHPQGGVWQLRWEAYRSQGTRDIATPSEEVTNFPVMNISQTTQQITLFPVKILTYQERQ